MTSFAKQLQTIYNDKRTVLVDNKETNNGRRVADIKAFFDSEVKKDATDKMMGRALVGRPTANILDYTSQERFYVNNEGVVVRYTNDEVNFPNYRISDIVMRDFSFKALLKEFEKELSCDENKITFSCWKPSTTSCVVEAIWGRNRYHTSSPNDHSSGGRGGGRGRGRGGSQSAATTTIESMEIAM